MVDMARAKDREIKRLRDMLRRIRGIVAMVDDPEAPDPG